MNEAEFDAKYDPQESPGQEEGSHFWTWNEVQAALKAGRISEQQVWTVVEDGEGGMGAAAGWHIVNKIAYYVTRVKWVGGDEYGEFDMPKSCFYCGSPIEQDEKGSWVDGVDGDGCDDSPAKVHSHHEVGVGDEEGYTPDEMDRMAQAYGEAPPDPDDGYYYSGTGEWSGDDSYIDYLNNS